MKSIKKPAAPPGAAELHRNPHPLLRAVLIVAAYLIAFIILDFITKQFEELRGVVAWYPPAGLTYTLLLVFGVRFAPAVTIALFVSSLFIYRMPQPPYLLVLWAFITSLIYTVAAAFLRHRIRFDWQMRKLRDVTRLVITAVFVSALLAVLSVSSSALSSDMPRNEVLRAIFLWWIGETVGVLTVTPFLLIHVMPGLKRFSEGQPVRLPVRRSFPRPTLSVIGQAFSIAFMFYWVFGGRVLDEFRPMYLIILPLIWIALDHGFKGITTGIVVLNFGVTLAMWFSRFDIAGLGELQLLMIVNCVVGLLMGAVVTERKRAEQELKAYSECLEKMVGERTRELRETQEQLVRQEKLAVLGQLAGGVGHELRNPLGVISNAIYFLRMTLDNADETTLEYLDIISSEVLTATKIVADLLDFARTRIPEREKVKVETLVAHVLDRHHPPENVRLTTDFPVGLSPLFVDPGQMGLVLGNLVTNAYQAMPEGGELLIGARANQDRVSLRVADTGCGIPEQNMKELFEPLFSTKARGIGLGLAISKNLAETNGGRIAAQSTEGVGSTFTLTLPTKEVQ